MMDKMSGHEIIDVLDEAYDRIGDQYGRIHFDDSLCMRQSVTENKGRSVSIYIGTKELVDDPDREYPIGEAMDPIVGFFHETQGHGAQIGYEFKRSSPLSQVLALNYYACRGSHAYYGARGDVATKQYFR